MSKELILKKHQEQHFWRIASILTKHKYYMDFSRMGTGKTYVASAIAEMLELDIFLVHPVSAKGAWESMKEYGIKFVAMISYQSLRGTEVHPPRHGYLERSVELKKDKKGKLKKKTVFVATQKFKDLVSKGILLVFDEGQSIKNKSDQGKAARALSLAIGGASKCAFLTGSPYDKEEHSENILRLLSILTKKRLVWNNPRTGEKVPEGLYEVIDYCKSLDPDTSTEILEKYPSLEVSAVKARSICHELFSIIVKSHLYSEMMPEKSFPLHVEESYIIMNGAELEELKGGIDYLARAARYNGKDVDAKEIEWGAVTLALKAIELSMTESLLKFTEHLLKDSKNKVILCVTFLDTVSLLMKRLSKYSPLLIEGSVKDTARIERCNLFNTLPKHRVLVSTIKTGGISLSLHDTVGNAPRHMVLIPTYSIIDAYQASGRIHRTDLKSDAYFYMLYGTDKDKKVKVTPILNALTRKKDVLKSLITKQSQVYMLPGEFPAKYYEL